MTAPRRPRNVRPRRARDCRPWRRVLVPSFAVGRAQELIYDLHQLARDRAIPEIPIVVDSPLAIDTTTVFEMHPEVFDHGEALVRAAPQLFKFPLLRFTHTVEESKAL